MSKTTRDEVHHLDALLAELTQAMRWASNESVGSAIQAHLIAAMQLMPLRHVEIEIPRDERYVVAAMSWGAKARAIVESLLTQ